jgi:hypothetical protein
MTKDVQLTAHWTSSIRPIQKVYEDNSLKKNNLVGKQSFSVQVFNVLGSFLGHISLYNTDMQFIKRSLKEAGFASGVYILRCKALRLNHRVQMR